MGRISKNDLILKYQKEFFSHFKTKKFVTSIAPGRINIIGEHTDYNLGLAMPIAIDRWICSIVSIREDDDVYIYSYNFNEKVHLKINNLDDEGINWKKYVFGCIKTFIDNYNITRGLNIFIGGNVPIGFGVSSSAALEVSLLSAFTKAFNQPIDNHKILELSNHVEQNYLGIKSGLLDQYASIFSKKNKPLLIDFSTLSHIYVDSQIKGSEWILVNSMVDRSLVNSKYNERVNECQMALKYINDTYNVKISINELQDEHLKELGKLNDQTPYKRILHLLSENKRVKLMHQALNQGDLNLVGNILNDSHDSLADNYEVSCKEINSIINISRQQKGFYGGRIMGGGFGGCCLCLVKNSKKELFIDNLIDIFYRDYKYEIKIETVAFSNGLELV